QGDRRGFPAPANGWRLRAGRIGAVRRDRNGGPSHPDAVAAQATLCEPGGDALRRRAPADVLCAPAGLRAFVGQGNGRRTGGRCAGAIAHGGNRALVAWRTLLAAVADRAGRHVEAQLEGALELAFAREAMAIGDVDDPLLRVVAQFME